MERLTYDITAGDFGGAGSASRSLKQHLKRIGADAEAVRRAMIAAYEAEMNVVIHSTGGVLEAIVAGDQLDVEVIDRGPGIPDVERARRDGFSTASAEARALGFGAGMGLPNIERNSDRLRVTSTVGEGTRVSFSIVLGQQQANGEPRWSLDVVPDLCRDCRRCVVACPTSAVRVRAGAPTVLKHLCVDCACCMAACPPQALTLQDAAGDAAGDATVLVVPPAVLAGFHPYAQPATVLAELRTLGYEEVVVTDGHEEALRVAAGELAAREGQRLPVVSPVCPAAVNLIELRFPALIPHLAPLASPLEAALLELGETEAAFVVSCPSQRTALLAQQAVPQRRLLRPQALRDALLPHLAETPAATDAAAGSALASGPVTTETTNLTAPAAEREGKRAAYGRAASDPATMTGSDGGVTGSAGGAHDGDSLVVTGASHVMDVLERLENGLLTGIAVVEPYLCEGGCFGSPLLAEEAHVAAWRWARAGGACFGGERRSIRPSPGLQAASRHPPRRGHGGRHPATGRARRDHGGVARQGLRRLRGAHLRRLRRGHRDGAR